MIVPKYIHNLCVRRAKLVQDLMSVDFKLSEWLDKNEILVDDCGYYGEVPGGDGR